MVRRSARLRNLVNSCDNHHPHQPLWTNQIAAVSSQESSEGEFVEEEKSWPPHRHSRSKVLMRQVTQKLPRPHSHLFRRGPGAGQTRGSGHSRRWENSAYLSSLHPISEDDSESSVLPDHHSAFTTLHTSGKFMQIWITFSSQSEEEQWKILQGDCVRGDACDPESVAVEDPPEERFRRIDKRIRSVLQHNRHLPLDLLASLEEELCFNFSLDPQTVLLSLQSNSFSRLLVHGLCQYMELESTTVVSEGANIVVVASRRNSFTLPQPLLSNYLKTR